jgi:hypothetical protein
MIEHGLRSSRGLKGKLKKLFDDYEEQKISRNELVKKVVRTDLGFAQTILGKDGSLLHAEVQKAVIGCEYFGTNSKIPVKASWSDVYRIAGEIGLDSSDAMIFNLVANNATFDGLITCDNDFQYAASFTSPRNFFVWIVR